MQSEQLPFRRTQSIALFLLVAAIGASVCITLILQWFPEINAALGPYYLLLVSWPIWAYFTALPLLVLTMYAGALGFSALARTAAFSVAVAALATWATLKTGYPLGELTYTTWIGPLVMDGIPVFFPLAWFAIAMVSVDLARRFTDSRVRRVLLAAVLMTLWNVALEPAMSRAFPLWIYADGGGAFGVPLIHWVGWFGVSAIIAAGIDRLVPMPGPTHRWATGVWTINVLYPAAISLLYGHAGAAVVGGLAAVIPLVVNRSRRLR